MRKKKEMPAADRDTSSIMQVLSTAEVASLLGVTKLTVGRLIRERGLPARLCGNNYRISLPALLEWLDHDNTAADDDPDDE
mgnify:CR=1 FL=1